MRSLTVVYKWESGKEGTFTHPQFPEPLDIARKCLGSIEDEKYREIVAQAMSTSPAFQSQFWGWFRQVLVTWRADAKRLREGNKSTAPLNAEETAKVMAAKSVPTYEAPSESLSEEQKIDKLAKGMTPAQIARFLAAAGITEYK
jgi:hypothetical protein